MDGIFKKAIRAETTGVPFRDTRVPNECEIEVSQWHGLEVRYLSLDSETLGKIEVVGYLSHMYGTVEISAMVADKVVCRRDTMEVGMTDATLGRHRVFEIDSRADEWFSGEGRNEGIKEL